MTDDLDKPSLLAAFEHFQIQVLGPDRGGWMKCQCPLPDHEDSNPSASVNEEAGRWRCHTCDKGGDVWDIVLALEDDISTFPEARRRAAELFGNNVNGSDNGSGLLPRRSSGHRKRSVRPAPWTRL